MRTRDLVTVGARWLLGAFFVYMGFKKALHPEHFLELIRQYQMVDNAFLLNALAAGLPWFEVLCGLLLLGGVAVRGAALWLILMLVPFSLVVAHRALAIAAAQGQPFATVKFDCGCGAGEVVIWKKLLENGTFILLAGWLLLGYGRQFSARFTVFGCPTQAPGDR